MNFEQTMREKVRQIEAVIGQYLPKEQGYQKIVIEAMNYSVRSGGKRLRPMLLWESYRLFGGCKTVVEPFLAAIEMIHTYSLVHDDLPAMDNDDYRRGRETTHKVYGEGMAVLAGDGLLNYAFETALQSFALCGDGKERDRVVRALGILASKAGIYGMIGGQTADIEAEKEGADVTEELLLYIHGNKTAALIQSAMTIGSVLAGADRNAVDAMDRCAYNIGVAFQIKDDILDVTSSQSVLGKPVGSDAKNNKKTYVAIHGLERSVKDVDRLSQEALAILDTFPNKNEFLSELVRHLITRVK